MLWPESRESPILYWSAMPETSGVDSNVVNICVDGLYPSTLLIM